MDTTKITRTTKHRPALLPPEDPRTNHNSNTTDTDTAADDAHEDGIITHTTRMVILVLLVKKKKNTVPQRCIRNTHTHTTPSNTVETTTKYVRFELS